MKVISACAPPACSCPELEITDDNMVVITDDFAGVVVMEEVQFETLAIRYLQYKGFNL